ncbi:hypothetical protein BOTBODRAFT_616427 [Botryobasidium botryosum FD-172 SS1]|uniref:C2H2-type domain-containing protein n=1 Tax=Botryobasidium botryosum (strain FD-172 SS1) TaxID=930990 RepID=A0A067LVL3_BOTB1|nr:hypothetical protein BOTBODRAFT_616427 [Botryobasidium botryosum FD-172 SS1]
MGGSKPKHISRPFRCSEPPCTKAFRTKPHLNRHMNDKHTRARTFRCIVAGCSRIFTQVGNRKLHLKTHEKRGDVLPGVEMTGGSSGAAPVTNDSGTRERPTTEQGSRSSLDSAFGQLSLEYAHSGTPGAAPDSTCITSGADDPRSSSIEPHVDGVFSSLFHREAASSPPRAGYNTTYAPHQAYPKADTLASFMNGDQHLVDINFRFTYDYFGTLPDFHSALDPPVPSTHAEPAQHTPAPNWEASQDDSSFDLDDYINFDFKSNSTSE